MTGGSRTLPAPGKAPVACSVCGNLLNRYADFRAGTVSFDHPMWLHADHAAVPIAAEEVDARYACDFCSDDKILFVFETSHGVQTVVETDEGTFWQDYGSRWSACLECAEFVAAGNLGGLHARVVSRSQAFTGEVAEHQYRMLAQVFAVLLPGRALTADGRWEPRPLPAVSLPKVRDRLARLVCGADGLPFGLGIAATRTPLAESLSTARLYWIDDQFTELTRSAARNMPRIAFTPADLPAAHGVLAWSQPVEGRRRPYVAASWTSHGDAVHIVGYRSVGFGLAPEVLQRLREDVGWLIPGFAARVRAGQPVEAGHPAAALVTTWRLIRQRIAETARVKVDKSIRKSYQRAGRPEPEVSLIRIRGTATQASLRPGRPGAPGAPGDREFRWWVTPHWRHQPYGPERALRDWIVVRPHLRGPQDKPIRATTTVRVLGKLPPRPDRALSPPAEAP